MTKRPKRVLKVAAFGCSHAPHEDQSAIEWLCDILADFKPDVKIHLGDLHEGEAASRWKDKNESDWTWCDELKSANSTLEQIRLCSKPAKCLFLPGNHDDNLMRPGRLPPDIRDRVDWRRAQCDDAGRLLNVELRKHWKLAAEYVYNSAGVHRIGQVTFGHGYETSMSADEMQAIKLGVPYGLWVGAHTHKPLPVTQSLKTKKCPLPYWYANAGCLRDLKPEYARRADTFLWGHGVVLCEIDQQVSDPLARNWTAETRIRN